MIQSVAYPGERLQVRADYQPDDRSIESPGQDWQSKNRYAWPFHRAMLAAVPTVLTMTSPFPVLRDADEPLSRNAIARHAERLVLHALREGMLFADRGRAARRRRDGRERGWNIELENHDGEPVVLTVKATDAESLDRFELTVSEWKAAMRLEHRYWLALVTCGTSDQPQIELLQDPARSQREGRLMVEPETRGETLRARRPARG